MAYRKMTTHLAFRDAPSGDDADALTPTSFRAPEAAKSRANDLRLRAMVDAHASFVARVLRNAGVPHADVDDEVQRTFITLARRLDDVHVGAERSFLLKTALYGAAHARRTLARRREVGEDEAPEMSDDTSSPEQLTAQKRNRQRLDEVLDAMGRDLRTVFVLYEFEELSMAEIAEVLDIPAGTVASRLRRARVEFRARVSQIEVESSRGDKR